MKNKIKDSRFAGMIFIVIIFMIFLAMIIAAVMNRNYEPVNTKSIQGTFKLQTAYTMDNEYMLFTDKQEYIIYSPGNPDIKQGIYEEEAPFIYLKDDDYYVVHIDGKLYAVEAHHPAVYEKVSNVLIYSDYKGERDFE